MNITNFSVTPAFVAPGDTMHVEFTLSVTKSDEVYGLHIYAGNGGSFIIHYDDSFRLAAGKSTKVAFDVVVSKTNSYIANNIGDKRYIVDPKWAIVLGVAGSRFEVTNPVTYINKHYVPLVENFSVERVIDGVRNDEGVHVITSLKVGISPEADISHATLKLYYADSTEPTLSSNYIDLTDKISTALAGVTEDIEIIPNSFSNGVDWYLMLVFGDEWESDRGYYSLPRAFANMHLSGQPNGGVCFGGFSSATEKEPKLESYFPSYFYGGISGVNLYSTEEVKTGGKWIDGKPIYRKTVSGRVTTTTGTAKAGVVGTIEDVDMPVGMYGIIDRDGAYFALTMYGAEKNNHRTAFTAGNVNFTTTHSATAYVTVEYTKTTDVAETTD